MGNARITKTLDFVPLSTRHIPAKPFFKISIFKKNIKCCQKYPKDPSMQKYNFSKKTFFLAKYYFLCLNMDYTHFNFLKVYNSPVAQNFKFLSFST